MAEVLLSVAGIDLFMFMSSSIEPEGRWGTSYSFIWISGSDIDAFIVLLTWNNTRVLI